MSEILATKSRDALGECTEEWQKNPVDPYEAAIEFKHKLGSLATTYDTYNSSSITSGGAKRFDNMSFVDVVEWNRDMVLRYADYLHGEKLIDLNQSIDAAALGHVSHWAQHEYLEFWMLVMSRPELSSDNISAMKKKMDSYYKRTDMTAFSDSTLPHKQRRPLYRRFETAFSRATAPIGTYPVSRVVQLVDRKLSLGCDVEARFATRHEIDLVSPAYGGKPEDFIATVNDTVLREQMGKLDDAGAIFIERADAQGLSLQQI